MNKIKGLVAAPFTPMHKDGSLNLDIIGEYYDFLAKNGVKELFFQKIPVSDLFPIRKQF